MSLLYNEHRVVFWTCLFHDKDLGYGIKTSFVCFKGFNLITFFWGGDNMSSDLGFRLYKQPVQLVMKCVY